MSQSSVTSARSRPGHAGSAPSQPHSPSPPSRSSWANRPLPVKRRRTRTSERLISATSRRTPWTCCPACVVHLVRLSSERAPSGAPALFLCREAGVSRALLVASLCRCRFAAAQAPRWWSVYAALTCSAVAFRVPGSGCRLRRVIRRSSTAQTSVRQLSSPANRPITLVGLLTSPRERSSRFVDRHRRRCRVGSARARRGRRDRRRGSWMRRCSRRCRARGRALGASAWRPLIASSSARRYACLTRSRSRSGSLA